MEITCAALIRNIAFIVYLMAWSIDINAQSSDVQKLVDSAQGNAVSIVATYGSTPFEGYGVVVSKTSDGYIVATAKHIVMQNESIKASSVSISAFGISMGTVTKMNLESPFDVAFLWVKGAPSAAWQDQFGSFEDPLPGEHAWIYGHDSSWTFKGEGTIDSVQQGILQINDLNGWKGESGAPVFSSYGLIGLYLRAHGLGTSDVLPLRTIRSEGERLDVPWSLTQAMWIPRSVKLTVRRIDTSEPEIHVRNLQTGQTFPIGEHDAYSGKYAVVFPFSLMQCAPSTFDISRTVVTQNIDIKCVPNLNGEWSNGRLRMLITRVNDYDYEFTGVSTSADPIAPASGRLQQNSADERVFFITAKTASGFTLGGSATVSPNMKNVKVHLSNGLQDSNETLERAQ
jgi:hypothetical protein